MFFAHNLAIELVAVALFFLKHGIAPGFKSRKTLFQPLRFPAIKPQRGARKIFEKASIMADQDQCRFDAFQLGFKPLDGRKVEMVGGLVQH